MAGETSQLPEPLRNFDGVVAGMAEELAVLDRLRVRYDEVRQAGELLANAVEALRIELTYHSNAIEGSTLTLRETQLVIEGQSPPSGRGRSMRELYEARNHDRALRFIESTVGLRAPTEPMTERDLLDVHALVLADIDSPNAGRLRSARVLIAGSRFVPPGSHKFAEVLPAVFQLANRAEGGGGVHPVLQAAELHYNLVAVHPFTDGNGRTGRLMMNWHLLKHGLPLGIIEVGERAAYLAALDEANGGRLESFSRLTIACVRRTLERLLGS